MAQDVKTGACRLNNITNLFCVVRSMYELTGTRRTEINEDAIPYKFREFNQCRQILLQKILMLEWLFHFCNDNVTSFLASMLSREHEMRTVWEVVLVRQQTNGPLSLSVLFYFVIRAPNKILNYYHSGSVSICAYLKCPCWRSWMLIREQCNIYSCRMLEARRIEYRCI